MTPSGRRNLLILPHGPLTHTPHTPSHWRMAVIVLIALTTLATPTAGQLTVEAESPLLREAGTDDLAFGSVRCGSDDDLGEVTYELSVTSDNADNVTIDSFDLSDFSVAFAVAGDYDFLCEASTPNGVVATGTASVEVNEVFDERIPEVSVSAVSPVVKDSLSASFIGSVTCGSSVRASSYVLTITSANADQATIVQTEDDEIFDVSYNAGGLFDFLCTATSPFGLQGTDTATVEVLERRLLTIEADTDIDRDIGRGETPSGFVNCTAPADLGDVTYELTATSGNVVSIAALDDNGTFNVTYVSGGDFLCTATNADGVVAAGTTQVTIRGFFAEAIPDLTAIAEENPVIIDPTSGQPATGNIICSDPTHDRSFPLPLVFTNLDVVDVIIGNAGDVTIEMTDPFGVFLVTYNAPGVFILNCSANTAIGGSDADSVTVAVVEGFDTLLVEADSPITLGTPSEEIVGNVNCSTTDQSEEGECILLDLSSDEESATIVGNQQTNGDFQVDYGEFSGIKAGIVEFYCICTDLEGAQRYGRTRVEVLDEAGQVTVDAQSPLLVEAGSDEPTFTTITCGFNDNLGEVTFELSVTSDNADNVTIEPFASGGVDFNVGFVVAGDYDFLCEASTPNGVVATGTASVEVNEFFDERIPEASIFAVSPVIKDSLSESFTGSVTCSASVRSSSYVLTITSANADQATIVETENKEIFDVSYIAGGLFDFLCIATTPFGLQGNDTATVEVLERRLLTIEADTDIDRDFLRGETPSGFVNCTAPDDLGDVTYELTATSGNVVSIVALDDNGTFNVTHGTGGDFLCTATNADGVVAAGTTQVTLGDFFDDSGPVLTAIAEEKTVIIDPTSGQPATGNIICSDPSNDRSFPLPLISTNLDVVDVIIGNTDDVTIEMTDPFGVFLVTYNAPGVFILNCSAGTAIGISDADSVTVAVVEGDPTLLVEADSPIILLPLFEVIEGTVNCSTTDQSDEGECVLLDVSSNEESANIVDRGANGELSVDYDFYGTPAGIVELICICTDPEGAQRYGRTRVEVLDGDRLLTIEADTGIDRDRRRGETPSGFVNCSAPDDLGDVTYELTLTNIPSEFGFDRAQVSIVALDDNGTYNVTYESGNDFDFLCTATNADGVIAARRTRVTLEDFFDDSGPNLTAIAEENTVIIDPTSGQPATGNITCSDPSNDRSFPRPLISASLRVTDVINGNADNVTIEETDPFGVFLVTYNAPGVYTFTCSARVFSPFRTDSDNVTVVVVEANDTGDEDLQPNITADAENPVILDPTSDQPTTGIVTCRDPQDTPDRPQPTGFTYNLDVFSIYIDGASIEEIDSKGAWRVTYNFPGIYNLTCFAFGPNNETQDSAKVDVFVILGPNLTVEAQSPMFSADPFTVGSVRCIPQENLGGVIYDLVPTSDSSVPRPTVRPRLRNTINEFFVQYPSAGIYEFLCTATVAEGQLTGRTTVAVLDAGPRPGEIFEDFLPNITAKAEDPLIFDPTSGQPTTGIVTCRDPIDEPTMSQPADFFYDIRITSDNADDATIELIDGKGAWLVTYNAAGIYSFNCTAVFAPIGARDSDSVDVNVLQGPPLTVETQSVIGSADPFTISSLRCIAPDNFGENLGDEVTYALVLKSESSEPLPTVRPRVRLSINEFFVIFPTFGLFEFLCIATDFDGQELTGTATVTVLEDIPKRRSFFDDPFPDITIAAENPLLLETPLSGQPTTGFVTCRDPIDVPSREDPTDFSYGVGIASDNADDVTIEQIDRKGAWLLTYNATGIYNVSCGAGSPIGARDSDSVLVTVFGCADDFCENGGTCVPVSDEIDDGFRCSCQEGYMGDRCETATSCPDDFCENGGTCVPVSDELTDGFRCSCPKGYSGDSCENCKTCETSPDQCVCRLLGDPIVETFVAGEFSLLTKAKLFTLSEQRKGDCAFSVEVQIGDYGNGGLIVPKYLTVTLNGGKTVVQFNDDHQFEVLKSKTNSAGVYDGRGRKFKLDNVGYEVDVIRNGDFLVIIDNVCGTKVGYDSEGLYTTATIVVAKNNADGLKGECGDCGNY